MPPKKNTENGSSGAPVISENHAKLIDAMFKISPASAKQAFDWTAVSKITGHKDAKSCRETFRQACEKYGWFKAESEGNNNNNDGDGTPATSTKKKATPKRPRSAKKKVSAAKVDNNDDDVVSDDEAELETPSKKAKLDEAEVKVDGI